MLGASQRSHFRSLHRGSQKTEDSFFWQFFSFFWQFAEYGDVFRNICLFGGGLPARWEMVLARKKGAGWNPKTSQKWHFLTIFDPCPFSKFPGWSHVHFSGPRGRGVPESGWELLAGNNWLDSWTPHGRGGRQFLQLKKWTGNNFSRSLRNPGTRAQVAKLAFHARCEISQFVFISRGLGPRCLDSRL